MSKCGAAREGRGCGRSMHDVFLALAVCPSHFADQPDRLGNLSIHQAAARTHEHRETGFLITARPCPKPVIWLGVHC